MTFDAERERRRLQNVYATDPSHVQVHLGDSLDHRPLTVPVSDFDRHAQFIGTTGGGKTRAFMYLFQELALNTQSAQVFLDVTGNAYAFLKRWAYSEALDERLVLIDPSEDRLICGVNPVSPWPDNHFLQAVLAWENISKALDSQGAAKMPLLAEWMCNVFYGVINAGLTMHEAPNLIDFADDRFRRALIPRLSERNVQQEFARLQDVVNQRFGAHRDWYAEAGAAHRRILRYTGNPRLRLMLGTTQRVIDWDRILDEHKLVLVNLHGVRNRNIHLAQDDSRMLGLQLLSELIETCWRRSDAAGDKAPPCYAFVDECQHFVSPNLERILSEGRQFNLRLLLAHRVGQELRNEEDVRFISLVSSCTQAKFAFGGLGYKETEEIARDMFGHYLPLTKVKDEIRMPIQTQYVKEVEVVTTTTGGAEGTRSGTSSTDSQSYDADANKVGSGTNSAFQDARDTMNNWSQAVSRHLQVFPSDPEERVVSRQYWRLDELLHQVIAKVIAQPAQHAVYAANKGEPVFFRVADVLDPPISYDDSLDIDLELMRALPFYSEAKLIEEEIRDRQADFLRLPAPPLAIDLPTGRKAPTPIKAEHRRKEP